MSQGAIAQISELLAKAGELRETLSNGERLQLMGLTGAFLGELERPDEAVFRMVRTRSLECAADSQCSTLPGVNFRPVTSSS